MICLKTLKILSKNIFDILLMTPKISVSIYIFSTPPGRPFRTNKILRLTSNHGPWVLVIHPKEHNPGGSARYPFSRRSPLGSAESMPQSRSFLPFAFPFPSLFLVTAQVRGNSIHTGQMREPPALETSCVPSASITCQSFIGIAFRVPPGTYLMSPRTQSCTKL